jgi:hypothetical protein
VTTQLANMAEQARTVLQTDKLEAIADRGYFNSPEVLTCHEAGITVTLPKPQTSGAKADGRSTSHAPAARNGRASVRHDEGAIDST